MSQAELLLQKYCPPLEESLFFAIASDFDVSNATERQQLQQILDDLKEQAIVEQELELAPPIQYGSSHTDAGDILRTTASSQEKTITTGRDNMVASVTTGISDLQTASTVTGSSERGEYADLPQELETASPAEKEKWLKTLFPMMESIQITETVARYNGDVQRSIDELLNLSFFHDDLDQHYVSPPVLKGVDGFLGEGKTKKPKSKKTRRKQDKDDLYLSDGLSSGAVTPSNIWKSAAEDVEFIVSRTQLSPASVKSIYHQKNANLALTIITLVTKEAESNAAQIENDDILKLQVAELKLELQGIADTYIYGALILAQMMPLAAKDLLEAMMTTPQAMRPQKLVAQYTPVNLSEDEAPRKIPQNPTVAIDLMSLVGKAGVHSVQADRAFTQASSAFRRGRSDHLMGGAAAYYASVGHEQRKKHKELIASASDVHVSQQSTANTLDLHGVSVEHAVRITKNHVEIWWDGLGDRKYVVGGVGNGYKIIVGLGTHSAQGIGKIGPAVSRMLLREGWKVNVQRGEIYVEGRARR